MFLQVGGFPFNAFNLFSLAYIILYDPTECFELNSWKYSHTHTPIDTWCRGKKLICKLGHLQTYIMGLVWVSQSLSVTSAKSLPRKILFPPL